MSDTSAARNQAPVTRPSRVTGPEGLPFRDEDFAEYTRLVRSRTTTPRILAQWMEERGYGSGHADNGAEVLTFHRRNPSVAPVNRYIFNPSNAGNPETSSPTDWLPDAIQAPVERAGLAVGAIDPNTYYGLGNYGDNAVRPSSGPVASAEDTLGWGERAARRASETKSEAGDGVNASFMRNAAENRDEQSIRTWAQNQGMTPEEADAQVAQARDNRGNRVREVRAQREGYWEDQDSRSGDGVMSWLSNASADLAGNIVGDINPTYLIAPGANAIRRTLGQGLVNAATDVGVQASEIVDNIKESFDPLRVAENAATGAAFQGGSELIGSLLSRGVRGTGRAMMGDAQSAGRAVGEAASAALEAARRPRTRPQQPAPVERVVEPAPVRVEPPVDSTTASALQAMSDLNDGGRVAARLHNDNPAPAVVPDEVAPEIAPDAPEAQVDTAPNIERVDSAEALDNELRGPVDNNTPPVEEDLLSARERRAGLAERLGYTPEEFDKLPASGTLDSVALERGVQLVEQSSSRIDDLLTRSQSGELTEAGLADLIAEIGRFQTVNSRLTTGISEGAKILDVAAARSRDPVQLAQLLDINPIQNMDDVRVLARRLSSARNTRTRSTLINELMDPRAEDYVLSLWYNAQLSHPATHVTNAIGNASHIGLEGFNKGVASLFGQANRGVDRVYGREVAGNLYGILRAFTTLSTYQRAGNILIRNENNKISENPWDKGKGAPTVLPGILSGAELPTRAMNASDDFWSSLANTSSLYGQASRIAAREGAGFGSRFYERAAQIMDNISADPKTLNARDRAIRDQMLKRASSTSNLLTFRDPPSAVAKSIERARQRRVNDRIGARAAKFGSRLFVPFVQTPDRIVAAVLRNSPLSALSASNAKEVLRGTAEGHRILARFTTGSAITSYLVYLADNGQLTGAPSSDYDIAQEQAAGGHQPFSVKIGDSWVSMRGLDPFATNARIVADLVNKYKTGEISDESYVESIRQVIGTIGNGLSESAYTENISNFLQMFEPGYRGDQAVNSLIPNIAQSFTTPAIIRGVNDQLDTSMRDQTGDGSLPDRILGRIEAGFPGLSSRLPQRYDVYGRPISKPDTIGGIATRLSVKGPEEDQTVVELQRLADVRGGALITPVGRGDLRNFEANAEQIQQYQQLSGQYILEYVRNLQSDPAWGQMTDAEKIEEVRGVSRDMRAAAREQLFPEYYGPSGSDEQVAVNQEPIDVQPAEEDILPIEEDIPVDENSTPENMIATDILSNQLGLQITDNGIRSREDQERYYRTGSGVAAPGTSPHEYGNAVDVRVPSNMSTTELAALLEGQGFVGVKIISRTHGTGPHWHIQWEGMSE